MILPLLATGLVGGLLSGMFGVGGGIVMVPMLMWWARMDQRRASTTSLVAIVPSAIVGSVGFGLNGEIDYFAAALIAVGAVIGAPIGAWLLRTLPLGWLRWLFISGLLIIAVRLILVAPERGGSLEIDVLPIVGLVALGFVMGVASGMFGIGGGVIAVPLLIALFGMGDLVAKGTSLLAMIPSALSGTIANLRAGMVDVRQGLIVGIAAACASLGGVALAFLVPPQVAGVLFGILLLAVVAQLSVRAIRAQRAARAGASAPTSEEPGEPGEPDAPAPGPATEKG